MRGHAAQRPPSTEGATEARGPGLHLPQTRFTPPPVPHRRTCAGAPRPWCRGWGQAEGDTGEKLWGALARVGAASRETPPRGLHAWDAPPPRSSGSPLEPPLGSPLPDVGTVSALTRRETCRGEFTAGMPGGRRAEGTDSGQGPQSPRRGWCGGGDPEGPRSKCPPQREAVRVPEAGTPRAAGPAARARAAREPPAEGSPQVASPGGRPSPGAARTTRGGRAAPQGAGVAWGQLTLGEGGCGLQRGQGAPGLHGVGSREPLQGSFTLGVTGPGLLSRRAPLAAGLEKASWRAGGPGQAGGPGRAGIRL